MKKLFWIFLISFFFRLIISFIVWHPDVNNHIDWGIRFWQYGPAKFYAPSSNIWSYTWPNQPPGTIYLFASIRKLFELLFYNVFSPLHFKLHIFPGSWLLFFESNLYPALLKLPSALSDIGIGYILYKWTNKRLAAVLWLVNPVVWYNSSLWGQTDSIVNFFALLSFYFLLQRKLNFSLVTFALSLYIKASLLIFFPIYLMVAIRQKYDFRKWFLVFISSLLVVGLLTLPFANGEPFGWLLGIYKDKVFTQQLHVITANAFNLWAGLTRIHERPETLPFLGLDYRLWGYILFAVSYIPALYLVYKKQDFKSIVWALAISAFSSFMLLTNMHERYLYPLFPYLTILVSLGEVTIFSHIAISTIALLNLYNFWWFPKIGFVVDFLSFGDRLVPRILGFINFAFFVYLYQHFLRHLRKASI